MTAFGIVQDKATGHHRWHSNNYPVI